MIKRVVCFISLSVLIAASISLNTSMALASTEEEFISLLNAERISLGKSPLANNAQLTNAAYMHAKEMAINNYFSHTSFDGRKFSDRIRNDGYAYALALGENIAYHSGPPNATFVFKLWKNSVGHYSNIISSSFSESGFGVYYANGRSYYVNDFGRRSGYAPLPISNNTIPQITLYPYANKSSPVSNPQQSTRPELPAMSSPPNLTVLVRNIPRSGYTLFRIHAKVSQAVKLSFSEINKNSTLCSSCNGYIFYRKVPANQSNELTLKAQTRSQQHSELRITLNA